MKKSVKINAVLNIIRTLTLIIFPLITFPYATRVLGASNLGKVQFASSIISYMSLIAALGLSMYATREGTKYRGDRVKLSKFASQMFSINLFFTLIAYVLLFITLLFPTKLQNYTTLILIQSISVLFTTLGVDWLYTINEDYLYITIRSVVTHIISLTLLFLFVHVESDYYIYAIISVVASSGTHLFNFFHSKKYCDLKIDFHPNLKTHFKSLIILFSNNLASQIYINADVTMLGLMAGDYFVGIYGVATKVYFMVKSVLNAMITVVIPRLSFYRNTNNEKSYNDLCSKIINACIILILPIILGLFLLSDEVVYLIAGKNFILASTGLKILSFSLFFAVFANFFANAILIVNKKEKYVLKATIIAALLNIALNFALIPVLKQNGTALTTLIAEIVVALISFYHARKYVKVNDLKKNIIPSIFGLISIFLICFLFKQIEMHLILRTICMVVLSAISYFTILIIFKNKIIIDLLKQFKNKLKKK